MKMSDFIWQHQKYARPEIFVVNHVLYILHSRVAFCLLYFGQLDVVKKKTNKEASDGIQ